MRLKRIEKGTYETQDRSFYIQAIRDATFSKDRWLVYSQVPAEKAWQCPERIYLANFNTLGEARSYLEVNG